MRIVVAFEDLKIVAGIDDYDAFWLADTALNRVIANEAFGANTKDANRAVFARTSEIVNDDDILARLEDVDLHHPRWRELHFIDVELTSSLRDRFRDTGLRAKNAETGFNVKK